MTAGGVTAAGGRHATPAGHQPEPDHPRAANAAHRLEAPLDGTLADAESRGDGAERAARGHPPRGCPRQLVRLSHNAHVRGLVSLRLERLARSNPIARPTRSVYHLQVVAHQPRHLRRPLLDLALAESLAVAALAREAAHPPPILPVEARRPGGLERRRAGSVSYKMPRPFRPGLSSPAPAPAPSAPLYVRPPLHATPA